VTGVDGRRIVVAIEAIEELSGELGNAIGLSELSRRWALAGETARGYLDTEDEEMVARMRAALAGLAVAARSAADPHADSDRAVIAALDGAELVMRGEILLGNGVRLSGLVPSFAFLATLPVTGKERALALSRRVEALLEDEAREQ
jgi:hypothetical protein